MEFLSKYKRIIESFLWVLILVFAYLVYDSINAPIKFNEVKNERFLKVIDKLKDIRNAQIAYKSVNGVYADNFDGLIKFIDTAQYTLIQKRDSSYMKYNRVYRIDMLEEIVVIDTLGFASVKDSLFGNSDRYKTMAQVPIDGIDKTFSIKADVINKNGYNVPVFEVKISKDDILCIKNAGAYGYTMSSNYNSRLKPAEACILNGEVKKIRNKQDFDDIVKDQIDIFES